MSIRELIMLLEKIVKLIMDMFGGFQFGDAEAGEDAEATV